MGLNELVVLGLATILIALVSSLLEPNHFLPPTAMLSSGKWSLKKTIGITLLCGAGFILSSLVIGSLGFALGMTVERFVEVESFRGTLSAWILVLFGLGYFDYRFALATLFLVDLQQDRWHVHSGKVIKIHGKHIHAKKHLHDHEKGNFITLQPWKLFLTFFLSPAKPFASMMIYPAAKNSVASLVFLTVIFVIVTLLSLVTIVLKPDLGIRLASHEQLDRYRDALAGATIFLCGVALLLL